MSSRRFLVTGGTGKTGRRVAEQLTARSVEVRAVSRSTTPAFDWSDEDSWDAALDGVQAVYLAPPDALGVTGDFARRAAAAGVERIVLLSARGVTTPGYFENQQMLAVDFLEREDGVKASGLEWAIIRPGWFMQNFDEGDFLEPIRRGRLELPVGDGAAAWIDADDIAAVMVAALADGTYLGETVEITGPRAVSVREVVELISAESGRAVDYIPVTEDAYARNLRASGVGENAIAAALAGLSAIRLGSESSTTDGVRLMLGREPKPIEDFVRRAAGTWR